MEKLLSEIPNLGRPTNASQEWLKKQGYTSGNDKMTLGALRKLGVFDGKGQPTEFYDALKNEDRPKIAEHVRAAYRELFELYPDAHKKDFEALRNFFRSNTDKGESVQRYMVRTFQTIAKRGDFDAAAPAPTVPTPRGVDKTTKTKTPPPGEEKPGGKTRAGGVTLNVNIQLQLPASAEGEVYDKLFEAMGKHLKGLATFE